MENLNEQQLQDYNNAETLAWMANDIFDYRRTVAAELAGSIASSTASPTTMEDFMSADKEFMLFNKAASVLMPPIEAFKDPEPEEQFASETVWNFMSPEQKLNAAVLRGVIAEKFKEYGVTTDSLRVVMSEAEDGKKVFTLIHAGNGIDIGDHSREYDPARSYNSVMDKKNDKLFKVDVNGKTYDTRSGMTDSAYNALYEDARRREDTILPDSKLASEEFKDDWTWTMLTGEPLTAGGRVRIRHVHDDRVYRDVCHPGIDGRGLRVRPAVVIE